jgi:hypothetical protein
MIPRSTGPDIKAFAAKKEQTIFQKHCYLFIGKLRKNSAVNIFNLTKKSQFLVRLFSQMICHFD